jgi:3-oxoacyl-(acyl-carrier-protein) synthase III
MEGESFRMPLYLPAQGAAETEATIVAWHVAEGDRFEKGQVLAEIDSAKSVFDFQAPCSGRVIRLLHLKDQTVPYSAPVLEIETSDRAMRDWLPPSAAVAEAVARTKPAAIAETAGAGGAVLLGMGGYLPERVVSNAELVRDFPEITEEYVYQVTGIRERRWAAKNERPSDMAYAAALDAIRQAGLPARQIDAVIVATTTPDVAMPSTACILQDRLNLSGVPAFDLNAACSGWLYAVGMARAMIVSGMARNVLTVGVDLQSRLLDHADRNAFLIFGDGAGAAVISAGESGHRIGAALLATDARGLTMARRNGPGYFLDDGQSGVDPWIRIDGPALFRLATESFLDVIRRSMRGVGWSIEDLRWIVPHQANGRILKAVAKRSGIPLERFFSNLDRLGNTSSASIPLALIEMGHDLRAGDRLVLCSVGAGITTAAVPVEW